MCWRAVWEATDVTEDGVTASGCGAENAWEVRAVRYSPVGDEVECQECVFGTSRTCIARTARTGWHFGNSEHFTIYVSISISMLVRITV